LSNLSNLKKVNLLMLEKFYYLQNKHRSTPKKSARRNLERCQ